MLIGVSLKSKDKDVDKLLAKRGFENAQVFYSPISTWLLLIVMLLSSAGGLVIPFIQWKYSFLFIPYFLISYLVAAYCNTSFAVYEDKVFAVNGNFPFRKLQIFERGNIKLITFDKMKRNWFSIFSLFGSNYVIIETPQKSYKYYCSGLELDGYDENWTEKTIDDLYYYLRNNNFPTNFKLEY